MSELIPFKFDRNTVRVVVDNLGEPWFVAVDVCEALDVRNVSQAVGRLDDDERSMFNIGRQGDAVIINESGLYSLILGSRKPEAKKFKKWVTSEVLPSIRKTGSYSVSTNLSLPNFNDPVEAARAWADVKESERNTLAVVDKQAMMIHEKDEYIRMYNQAALKAGEILVREFVKSNDLIDLGEKQFYAWMRDQGLLMANNEPYQLYVKKGYFTWKPTEVRHGGKYRYTLRITPRGKVWLASRYMAYQDAIDMGVDALPV